MELEELKVYNLSMKVGEDVWNLVNTWDYFNKDTVGKQIVRSSDSIAANLSEGFGRFHFKEAINYGYFSRGSLFETKTWLAKAHERKLINDDQFNLLIGDLNTIGKMLNKYIKSIGHSHNPNQ